MNIRIYKLKSYRKYLTGSGLTLNIFGSKLFSELHNYFLNKEKYRQSQDKGVITNMDHEIPLNSSNYKAFHCMKRGNNYSSIRRTLYIITIGTKTSRNALKANIEPQEERNASEHILSGGTLGWDAIFLEFGGTNPVAVDYFGNPTSQTISNLATNFGVIISTNETDNQA